MEVSPFWTVQISFATKYGSNEKRNKCCESLSCPNNPKQARYYAEPTLKLNLLELTTYSSYSLSQISPFFFSYFFSRARVFPSFHVLPPSYSWIVGPSPFGCCLLPSSTTTRARRPHSTSHPQSSSSYYCCCVHHHHLLCSTPAGGYI